MSSEADCIQQLFNRKVRIHLCVISSGNYGDGTIMLWCFSSADRRPGQS